MSKTFYFIASVSYAENKMKRLNASKANAANLHKKNTRRKGGKVDRLWIVQEIEI